MISALGSVGEHNDTLAYLFNANASLWGPGTTAGGGTVGGGPSTVGPHGPAAPTPEQTNVTSEAPVFPGYVRTASMVFCIAILGIGVVGNIMVPLVIMKTKDMRNSTNIFLMNLSIADLMVLLVCTPTVLVEVNSKPDTWVLGEEMCKAVPFIELTVAHASVLTILAISFERYYAICEPLRAGYVCTKTRAILICLLAWAFAAIFTSPITVFSQYTMLEYIDGDMVPVCQTLVDTSWMATVFILMTISVFFLVPLGVLIVLYTVIARHLMADPGTSNSGEGYNQRARKQVVLMLGTVVLSFFLCLLPFRVFTLWIIIVPYDTIRQFGVERYFSILYFCRIMLYLNSAINPILYNLMSSKFRHGFRRLIGIRRRGGRNLLLTRDRPTLTTTLSHSSTRMRGSPDLTARRASLDSRQRNGSIRRNLILRSSLLREETRGKQRPNQPQSTESYV